ncbi:hypothetical protein JL722_7247 [Aureococcus anophagefferens]|nr:hypothetical protein JL722_7247 [Aureococcus anophagefferens]
MKPTGRGRGVSRGRGRGRAVPFAHHYEAQGLLQRGGAVSGGTLEPRLPRRAAVETGGGLDFAAVVGGATREFDSLKRKAHEVLESGRIFVTWRNLSMGMDCVNVGPHSRCFCGHSYKAHAWWENKSKKPRCRCKGCPSFSYLPGRGAQHARCSCKHLPEDHRSARGLPTKCSKCACKCFAPAARCACGAPYGDHATIVETVHDRRAAGRSTEPLWDERSETHAVAGGLTSFASLAPGVDRAALHPSLALPRPDDIPSPYGAAPPRRPGRGRGRRALPAPSPADRAQGCEDFINSLGD